jgi:hypothetical protein
MSSRTLLLPALVLVLFTSTLGAQSDSSRQTPCSYDACALRQDGSAIRRGLAGEKVANIGIFAATDFTTIVRGDSAAGYARQFNHQFRRGTRLIWGGLVITEGALAAISYRMHDGQHFGAPESALLGVAVGGFIVSQIGGKSLRRARTAASKAIWWHNRDLTR